MARIPSFVILSLVATMLLLLGANHAEILVVPAPAPAPAPEPANSPTLSPRHGTTEGSLQPQECGPQCTERCSKTHHRKPCMSFCQKCCAKCLCVPPGTYGNKKLCPCYNNWKTKRGGPKCP